MEWQWSPEQYDAAVAPSLWGVNGAPNVVGGRLTSQADMDALYNAMQFGDYRGALPIPMMDAPGFYGGTQKEPVWKPMTSGRGESTSPYDSGARAGIRAQARDWTQQNLPELWQEIQNQPSGIGNSLKTAFSNPGFLAVLGGLTAGGFWGDIAKAGAAPTAVTAAPTATPAATTTAAPAATTAPTAGATSPWAAGGAGNVVGTTGAANMGVPAASTAAGAAGGSVWPQAGFDASNALMNPAGASATAGGAAASGAAALTNTTGAAAGATAAGTGMSALDFLRNNWDKLLGVGGSIYMANRQSNDLQSALDQAAAIANRPMATDTGSYIDPVAGQSGLAPSITDQQQALLENLPGYKSSLTDSFNQFDDRTNQIRQDLIGNESRLMEASLNPIREQRDADIGRLTADMGRRGIMGSSIANNQIGNANRLYSRAISDRAAQTTQAQLSQRLGIDEQRLNAATNYVNNLSTLDRGTQAGLAQMAAQELQMLGLNNSSINNLLNVAGLNMQQITGSHDAYGRALMASGNILSPQSPWTSPYNP